MNTDSLIEGIAAGRTNLVECDRANRMPLRNPLITQYACNPLGAAGAKLGDDKRDSHRPTRGANLAKRAWHYRVHGRAFAQRPRCPVVSEVCRHERALKLLQPWRLHPQRAR